jgi:hypothetical protein
MASLASLRSAPGPKMKCDAKDCDAEATVYELFYGSYYDSRMFKWCDNCYLKPQNDNKALAQSLISHKLWKVISKDEFVIHLVMQL